MAILKQLQTLLLDEGLILKPIDPTTHLIEEAGLDSFELVQLVMAINHTFQIEIPSTAITPENFATLESLEKLILSLKD